MLLTLSLVTAAALAAPPEIQTPPPPAPQQPQIAPCASRPGPRQFDFWVGEWDVFVGGKLAGTNRIEKILNDCVLQENWTDAGGGTGKSWNWYDIGDGKWHQLWLSSSGAPQVNLTGSYADGVMRYEGTTVGPGRATVHNRLQFFKLENGRVRQLWEQSNDGGKTWTVAFDGEYRPRQ